MSEVKSHRDLIVWRKAIDLAVMVYQLTQSFPKTEVYGLTAQVRRSAASVPANIAEGHARGSGREYAHFLAIAKGSLMETETHLVLATRLGYATDANTNPVFALVIEVDKMLTTIRSKLSGS